MKFLRETGAGYLLALHVCTPSPKSQTRERNTALHCLVSYWTFSLGSSSRRSVLVVTWIPPCTLRPAEPSNTKDMFSKECMVRGIIYIALLLHLETL